MTSIVVGAWSPEEVQELTDIVRAMMSRQGGSAAGISWADVAARMGHKRNGQQCRNKWCGHAALSPQCKKVTFAAPLFSSGYSPCTAATNTQGWSGARWTRSSLCTSKRSLAKRSSRHDKGTSLYQKERDPETLKKKINPGHRVASIAALDESEIIWSKFPDPGWNRWSSYQLRRKWRTLKRSVPGHEKMSPRGE
jgi:hypothetical protein